MCGISSWSNWTNFSIVSKAEICNNNNFLKEDDWRIYLKGIDVNRIGHYSLNKDFLDITPTLTLHSPFETKWRPYSYTAIENRIYREEFTRKKWKTAILLYCFHTAGVLHIFMLYNLLGPGISFYRKSKIIGKRKPNYEIGWFHNWPMIISHRLYVF